MTTILVTLGIFVFFLLVCAVSTTLMFKAKNVKVENWSFVAACMNGGLAFIAFVFLLLELLVFSIASVLE